MQIGSISLDHLAGMLVMEGVIPLNSSGLRPRFCFGGPLPGDFRWGTLIADNQEQHTKTRKMVE